MAYDHLEIEARWGTSLGEDNERMSKSRGNVVNPDDIGREYGRTRPSGGHRDGGGRGRATPHGAAPALLMVSNASGDSDNDGEMLKSRPDMVV